MQGYCRHLNSRGRQPVANTLGDRIHGGGQCILWAWPYSASPRGLCLRLAKLLPTYHQWSLSCSSRTCTALRTPSGIDTPMHQCALTMTTKCSPPTKRHKCRWHTSSPPRLSVSEAGRLALSVWLPGGAFHGNNGIPMASPRGLCLIRSARRLLLIATTITQRANSTTSIQMRKARS